MIELKWWCRKEKEGESVGQLLMVVGQFWGEWGVKTLFGTRSVHECSLFHNNIKPILSDASADFETPICILTCG